MIVAITGNGGQRNGEVVLSVRGITVGFGSNVVLDKLDLDIYRGEILGFVGASGAGKSVLMRSILRPHPAPGRHDRAAGHRLRQPAAESERFELD